MNTKTKVQEIFKDIPNYKGLYQVSNLGRVKRLYKFAKERILSPSIDSDGYYVLSLSKQGVVKSNKTHQLVAIAFLNHKPCGMEKVINHINFDKLDNRIENLEIVTARENSNKKHLKSTSKYVGVSLHKQGKWIASIGVNGHSKYIGLFDTEKEAHDAYKNQLLWL